MHEVKKLPKAIREIEQVEILKRDEQRINIYFISNKISKGLFSNIAFFCNRPRLYDYMKRPLLINLFDYLVYVGEQNKTHV